MKSCFGSFSGDNIAFVINTNFETSFNSNCHEQSLNIFGGLSTLKKKPKYFSGSHWGSESSLMMPFILSQLTAARDDIANLANFSYFSPS